MKRKSTLIIIVGVAAVSGIAALITFRVGAPRSGAAGARPETSKIRVTEKDRELIRTAYIFDHPGNEPLSEYSNRMKDLVFRDQQWAREAEFLPLGGQSASIMSAWESSVENRGAADDAQIAELLRTIARHANVRALDSPDAYIDLIDNDPGLEWNDPDPADPERLSIRRRNFKVNAFFTWFVDGEFDDAALSKTLVRDVWDDLSRFNHLIEAVGVGPRGARILVATMRSEEQLKAAFYGLHGKYEPPNREYWSSIGGGYGMQFSRPTENIDDLLSTRRPSVPVAMVNLIVRMRDGNLGNWQSVWRLHPVTNTWQLDTMQATSGKTVMLVW